MINELYQLNSALVQANIPTESWHRKYLPLPNVRTTAPCVRIVVQDGHIQRLESLSNTQVAQLRKYGSNQGTFPAMNLAPLYRLTDTDQIALLQKYLQNKLPPPEAEAIAAWCTQSNWESSSFLKQFRNHMISVPQEMAELLRCKQTPVQQALTLLQEQLEPLTDPKVFHQELTEAALKLLRQKSDVAFALQILFFPAGEHKAEKDHGTLSTVLDSTVLERQGTAVVWDTFTTQLNSALLQADQLQRSTQAQSLYDAFGTPFAPLEDPMPSVKLAAGFEVTLRTMFNGQPCQYRYRQIGNDTYPLSPQRRTTLQSALSWLASSEREYKTWLRTDKNECFFAYPSRLPQVNASFVSIFHPRAIHKESSFEAEAKQFVKLLYSPALAQQPIDFIHFFVLRKIDKAKTKIVYTYGSTPKEIAQCSHLWSIDCKNLPDLSIGTPHTIFPLQVGDALNRIYRQDGTLASDQYKPVPAYHGMELFFGAASSVYAADLSKLLKNLLPLAPLLSRQRYGSEPADGVSRAFLPKLWQALALLALLLSRLETKKEDYMQDFPYLFGQLLKISDELHILYCRCERKGDVPSQLAGGSLFVAASETPYQAFAQLAQRMIPYITWAKHHRARNQELSGYAGWCLRIYQELADRLAAVLPDCPRMTDSEKAQLFLGYLASLPKKDTAPQELQDTIDKQDEGGFENE